MSLKFLGDKWFGQDVDHILAYQTPRIVKIYDRSLGCMKTVLMLIIFVYIFIFNIWFKGAHFRMQPISGLARQQWQEPVKGCNPFYVECQANYNSIKNLPYCNGYQGDKPEHTQRNCDYYDARELPVYLPDGVLLPTFFAKYEQKRACSTSQADCDGKWKYTDSKGALQTGNGYAVPSARSYVADAEDFTLLIDHTIRSNFGNAHLSFDDRQMQGYYEDPSCDDCEKPVVCLKECSPGIVTPKDVDKQGKLAFLDYAQDGGNHSTARRMRAGGKDQQMLNLALHGADSAEAAMTAKTPYPIFSIEEGDVISLRTLLQFAGVDLDKPHGPENEAHQPVRLRGIALIVNIDYHNLEPWTLFTPDKPKYKITVKTMPADTFRHATVEEHNKGTTRELKLAYGVLVIVTQTGSLAFFDIMTGLIALTSALALLAVSNTITEFMMLSVLPRKDEYTTLKYKESGDFNEHDEGEKAK